MRQRERLYRTKKEPRTTSEGHTKQASVTTETNSISFFELTLCFHKPPTISAHPKSSHLLSFYWNAFISTSTYPTFFLNLNEHSQFPPTESTTTKKNSMRALNGKNHQLFDFKTREHSLWFMQEYLKKKKEKSCGKCLPWFNRLLHPSTWRLVDKKDNLPCGLFIVAIFCHKQWCSERKFRPEIVSYFRVCFCLIFLLLLLLRKLKGTESNVIPYKI